MKKYNLRSIMKAAWGIFRKGVDSFAVALRMAWANVKSHNSAKEAAGIIQETNTWYGWQQMGYEVRHESKALYQVVISDPATKSGTRKMSYFGLSQVQQISA